MAALRLDVVVFLYSKLEILSPQIQSTPAQGSAFWLRPSGRAMNKANKVAIARALEEAGIEFVAGPPAGLLVHRPELLDTPPKPRKITSPGQTRGRKPKT